MPVNAHPEYISAEKKFGLAESQEEKLQAMEEMVRFAPSHKGAENLRASLRLRYKKLKESIEKGKKKTGGRQGIKKYEMQIAIVGFPNSGKSSLFQSLTEKSSNISEIPYSTTTPDVGMMNFETAQIQVIDMPPFPNIDRSIINSADSLLIVVDDFNQIQKAQEILSKSNSKKIIVFTKIDKLTYLEKRKLEERLKSKRYNFLFFSAKTKENLDSLKKTIFETFPIIRVYTKEPGKEASKIPMILKKDSNIIEVGEKILKGFSKKVKRAKVWGPSSKFPGQIVGLDHILKDKDVVEFQTR